MRAQLIVGAIRIIIGPDHRECIASDAQRLFSEIDGGIGIGGPDMGDHRNAPGDLVVDDAEQLLALLLGQSHALAHGTAREDRADAGIDIVIDHLPQNRLIDLPRGIENRRQGQNHPANSLHHILLDAEFDDVA
jgi:hypothetical protein